MQKKWDIKKIAEAFGFKAKSDECTFDCSDTLKHVMMALDDELSNEEEKKFLAHINNCSRCLEKYEIEKSFKLFLTEKIARHTISIELIEQIRFNILGKADR